MKEGIFRVWVAAGGCFRSGMGRSSQEEVLFSWVPKDESLGDEGAIY